MRRILKTSVLALCLAAILFIVLLGASIHTYNTLTEETLIAQVRFERTGEQEFLAYIRTGDLDHYLEYIHLDPAGVRFFEQVPAS